jgi:hypothetical protein
MSEICNNCGQLEREHKLGYAAHRCRSFTARPDEPKGDKDATLANLRIDTPEDIQHYGNNALAILSTTVATIKLGYNDYRTTMLARVERMERALNSLKKIIDQSSSRLQAERTRREEANESVRYALATFRALDQYTFEDSDHALLIAEAVKKLEAAKDSSSTSEAETKEYRSHK